MVYEEIISVIKYQLQTTNKNVIFFKQIFSSFLDIYPKH